MTLEDFPTFARSHWSVIRQALLDGAYQSQPVRRVRIPKPNGGERWLGIPSVVDRVISQAIGQVLTPIFDPGSSESSFGFRPGRSAHGAVQQVQRTIGEGYRIVLMARVARKARDKCFLGLIGRYLRAGVRVRDIIQATEPGTPQGSPLTNILLDDLDKELERRGHGFARYADDLRILVRSQRAGERVKASITRYLTRGQRAQEPGGQDQRRCVSRIHFSRNETSLDGPRLRGLQAYGPETYRTKLGRLDVFRHLGLLSTLTFG